MSVKEIEIAITQLDPSDVSELASWVADYHQNLWDEQIEDDLESGCLDALLVEVDAEYEAGMATPL